MSGPIRRGTAVTAAAAVLLQACASREPAPYVAQVPAPYYSTAPMVPAPYRYPSASEQSTWGMGNTVVVPSYEGAGVGPSALIGPPVGTGALTGGGGGTGALAGSSSGMSAAETPRQYGYTAPPRYQPAPPSTYTAPEPSQGSSWWDIAKGAAIVGGAVVGGGCLMGYFGCGSGRSSSSSGSSGSHTGSGGGSGWASGRTAIEDTAPRPEPERPAPAPSVMDSTPYVNDFYRPPAQNETGLYGDNAGKGVFRP